MIIDSLTRSFVGSIRTKVNEIFKPLLNERIFFSEQIIFKELKKVRIEVELFIDLKTRFRAEIEIYKNENGMYRSHFCLLDINIFNTECDVPYQYFDFDTENEMESVTAKIIDIIIRHFTTLGIRDGSNLTDSQKKDLISIFKDI